jgi:hypothetical protein
MDTPVLITATLHVEVQLSNSAARTPEAQAKTRAEVTDLIQSNYDTVHLGRLEDLGQLPTILSQARLSMFRHMSCALRMTKVIAEASGGTATTKALKPASSRCPTWC